MADTTLPAFDPGMLTQLQGLLTQFQPSEQDKADARRQAIITLGLGLLGAPKGGEWAQAGKAGLLAMQGYQQRLQQEQALRNQNIQAATPLIQLMQRNQIMQGVQNALTGAQAPTPVDTTVPQGAVGGSGMGGGTPALFGQGSQPGPTAGPAATAPAFQADPNVRQRLANVAVMAKTGANIDLSPELNFMFPKGESYRPGGYMRDAATGRVTFMPKFPEGTDATQNPDGTWTTRPVQGMEQAIAMPEVTRRIAALATEPQTGIIPGGGKGIVGTKLSALGGANGPYAFLNGALGDQTGAPNAPTAGAPAPARGTVQTELGPEQTKNSESLGEDRAAYRTAISQSSKALAQLNELSGTLKYFTPGPMLPALASMAGVAQQVPGIGRPIANFLVPNSATALPAIAAMEKTSVGLTAEQSKVFGAREGQQVIGMIKSAMPNAAMVPGAPEVIIDSQKGMHQWIVDKGIAAERWTQTHPSLSGFSEAWDQAHPVSSYVDLRAIENIAKGLPPNAQAPSSPAPQQSGQKSVVRTGTLNGRRVVQYSDGTTAYAQ